MCGFGGIINSNENITLQNIRSIAAKVSFRGPDSCGIRIMDTELKNTKEGPHALFFNRLAIVDLDPRSDQPFEDDRHLLIYNGEIYNYPELKVDLQKKGILFHTTSDTEVLFYLLREYGIEGILRLNGMFAFLWVDKTTRTFTIARDRLGIKPLYYSFSKGSFAFSSELDSILRLTRNERHISPAAVDMYLWMQFVPSPYTIIEGINKLPPGQYISCSIDAPVQCSPIIFWDAYEFAAASHEIDKRNLEQILNESLQRQLHADVPLGLFLSSGVDSSLLAALVNKYASTGKIVDFFTVKFEENTASDESNDADDFIAGFHNPALRCNTIEVSAATIRSQISDLYSFYDEPFGDPAALLNWSVSRKAREFVTVAISGDGADELFWGYSRYNRWQKFRKISQLPGARAMAGILGRLPSSRLLDNCSFVLEQDPVKRHFNFFLPSGMRDNIRNPITRYPMWAMENANLVSDRRDMTALMDIKTYLADAMLYKVDRSSMATSLEVRVPYLDNEVLEYALKLPLDEKSDSTFAHKAPLKNLLQQLAPHYDLSKPKKGFNFPLEKWLKSEWKDLVLDTITKADLDSAGLDSRKYLKLVNNFYSSRNRYFTDVWYIFNLALWIKKIKAIE